jgi:hypothetical protein
MFLRKAPQTHYCKKKPKEMTMKRTTIAKALIATAMTLALGIVPKVQAEDGCSNATLNGTYGFRAVGTLVPLPPPALIAIVGTQTFDGNGGFTGSQMVSINGNLPVPPLPSNIAGTYQVNPDCTGTFSFQPFPGVTDHFFFVIDDNRKEFQVIQTDTGTVVTATARKQ